MLKIILIIIILIKVAISILVGILDYKKTKKEIPDVVKDVYEEEKYKTWLNYYNENFRLSLIVKVFMAIISVTMLMIFSKIFNDILINIGITNQVLLSVLFLVIIEVVENILVLPIYYYDTFVIEEKYGFNKTTKKQFFIDQIKNKTISLVLYSVIYGSLITLYIQLGMYLILYGLILIFSVLIIIIILYGAVFSKINNKQTPLEEGTLKEKITEFANKMNYPLEGIYVIDGSKRSTRGNAACTGLGKFKRILLFDTLLDQLTEEEIVAVLAHEIGHSKHKHSIKQMPLTIINILIMLVLLFVLLEYDTLHLQFGISNINYGLTIFVFATLLTPISAIVSLISNYFSRKFEYQADKYSVDNYDKEIMITAMKKLTSKNFGNMSPHFLKEIHHSHPSLVHRIEYMKKL